MDDGADDGVALLIIYLCTKQKKKRKRKSTNDYVIKRNKSSSINMLRNVELTTLEHYRNLLRMDSKTYEELLEYITPAIRKHDTLMRDAITPNVRLSATLCFLASGQSYEDLKFLTNISAQSLGKIIIETCKAIIKTLKLFIRMPNTSEEWKSVAYEFANKWNFNHCVGAIDGKHVKIVKPHQSGSMFFNYKRKFSFVIMALVNANYEFLSVEVGINGKSSNVGVFGQSKLKDKYDKNFLNLPAPEKLPLSEDILPYVFVGNDAFPLLENLMNPYGQNNLTAEEQVYNNRLSKVHRVVENAFGILANRFRVLQSTIYLCPEKASIVALACCYLHNFLSQKNANIYLRNSENAEENYNLDKVEPIAHDNASNKAKNIRNQFCNYFNTTGTVL